MSEGLDGTHTGGGKCALDPADAGKLHLSRQPIDSDSVAFPRRVLECAVCKALSTNYRHELSDVLIVG